MPVYALLVFIQGGADHAEPTSLKSSDAIFPAAFIKGICDEVEYDYKFILHVYN